MQKQCRIRASSCRVPLVIHWEGSLQSTVFSCAILSYYYTCDTMLLQMLHFLLYAETAIPSSTIQIPQWLPCEVSFNGMQGNKSYQGCDEWGTVFTQTPVISPGSQHTALHTLTAAAASAAHSTGFGEELSSASLLISPTYSLLMSPNSSATGTGILCSRENLGWIPQALSYPCVIVRNRITLCKHSIQREPVSDM